MLGIKRIDHVSMATADLQGQERFFRELFDMETVERFSNPREGFAGVALRIPGSETRLEILEPSGDASFLERFVESGGPSLHHLTFEVEDIERAKNALAQRGIEPFGVTTSHGWHQLFIHPRDTGGVLIQLYQLVAGQEEGPAS